MASNGYVRITGGGNSSDFPYVIPFTYNTSLSQSCSWTQKIPNPAGSSLIHATWYGSNSSGDWYNCGTKIEFYDNNNTLISSDTIGGNRYVTYEKDMTVPSNAKYINLVPDRYQGWFPNAGTISVTISIT